jgi:DNA-binding NarL/FixJ family response regulator
MNETTRILIVDDQVRTREGLIALLATCPQLEVVAQVQDGLQAVEAAKDLQPDVILMDVRMPGMDGLVATRRIKEISSEIKIIVLTMYGEYRVEAQEAGADVLVLKGSRPELLMSTLDEVMSRSRAP